MQCELRCGGTGRRKVLREVRDGTGALLSKDWFRRSLLRTMWCEL
jgi:hypothetical protein